jgi:hypothetical protein
VITLDEEEWMHCHYFKGQFVNYTSTLYQTTIGIGEHSVIEPDLKPIFVSKGMVATVAFSK